MTEGSGTKDVRTPGSVMIYFALVTLLLGTDWFAPTGELFREFGAKPATVLLTLGGMGAMLFLSFPEHASNRLVRVVLFFGAWLLLGTIAFTVNVALGWSDWTYARNPLSQFVAQSALLLVCGIAVLGNGILVARYPIVRLVRRLLPWVAAFHLAVFMLEGAGFLDDSAGPLLLFRSEGGVIAFPTGLTSEPSYFGTLAGLLGTSLLVLRAQGIAKFTNVVLALALYCGAFLINAKTLLVVVAAQAVFLLGRHGATAAGRILASVLLVVVLAGAVFFASTLSALDVEENLSTTNRLGSALLALNAAKEGYALTGIGVGQFHFFYRDVFAPNFLFLSLEALTQLDPAAEHRASTYNMYARVLLELGVVGAALLAAAIVWLFRMERPNGELFPHVMLAGALGFLLTQDTYVYPPLILASALLIGSAGKSRASE